MIKCDEKYKTIIIVHVNDNYKDISDIFFELFKINWPDCPFQVIVSYKKYMFNDYSYEAYVADKDSTLPNDVLCIMNAYKADYSISFLGDAFITDKINTSNINDVITSMIRLSAGYCRLFNSSNKAKKFSRINFKELYAVSFIAFIVSKSFAEEEFKNISDLEFELKYLNSAKNSLQAKNNMFQVPNNLFNISHGIVKGVWVRQSYYRVKAILGDKFYTTRKKMPIINYLIYSFRLFVRRIGLTALVKRF